MSLLREFLGKFFSKIPNAYFERKTKILSNHIDKVEEKVFAQCIALVDGSPFANDFYLNASMTLGDFRRNMPILRYHDVETYIARMMQGSLGLLSPGIDVPFFARTSGTTGTPKYIPVTNQGIAALKSTGIQWGCSLYSQHSYLFGGYIANIVSDWGQLSSPSGVPCGDLSGLINHYQPWYVKKKYLISDKINKISDQKKRYFFILRTLLSQPELEFISTATPATLIALARWGDDWKVKLIKSIFDGTVDDSLLWGDDGRKIAASFDLKPNRSRARALDDIASKSGTLLPYQYWPNKKLISMWTGGDFSHYRRAIGELYGSNTVVRDLGLLASEGAFTIPVEDETDLGLLNASRYFVEFLPIDKVFDSSNLLRSYELEAGGKYELVITTPNGLVRYAQGDVVECSSTLGRLPIIRFLSKVENISDLTGEKLTSFQVSAAIKDFLLDTSLSFDFCTLAPMIAEKPFYSLVIPDDVDFGFELKRFAQKFDEILRSYNFIYHEHRELEKIGMVRICQKPIKFFQSIRDRHLQKNGTSIEQYKFPCLLKNKIDLQSM